MDPGKHPSDQEVEQVATKQDTESKSVKRKSAIIGKSSRITKAFDNFPLRLYNLLQLPIYACIVKFSAAVFFQNLTLSVQDDGFICFFGYYIIFNGVDFLLQVK